LSKILQQLFAIGWVQIQTMQAWRSDTTRH